MGVMVNFNWVIADAIRSRYEKPSGIKNPTECGSFLVYCTSTFIAQ